MKYLEVFGITGNKQVKVVWNHTRAVGVEAPWPSVSHRPVLCCAAGFASNLPCSSKPAALDLAGRFLLLMSVSLITGFQPGNSIFGIPVPF